MVNVHSMPSFEVDPFLNNEAQGRALRFLGYATSLFESFGSWWKRPETGPKSIGVGLCWFWGTAADLGPVWGPTRVPNCRVQGPDP